MEQLSSLVASTLDDPRIWLWVRSGVILAFGFVLAGLAGRLSLRLTEPALGKHRAIQVRRAVYYGVIALFVANALRELGFHMGVLLGAAGILSVAVGFASQTAASNLISGLFLLGERAFGVGDVIKVGDITGEVLSVDLLSVKLRTFDNLFVRLPNEQLMKSQTTTLTRFAIRRYDLQVGVAYKESLTRVREVLMQVAEANPLCLDDPPALFIFQGFADSALNIQFSVWAKRENFLDLRNSIAAEIKEAFDRNAIEIPFPHRTLYAGSATQPLPVRMISDP